MLSILSKIISHLSRLLLFFAITILLLNGRASAASISGQWGTGNYIDIHISGSLAGCAAGGAGIDIFDISDPTNPRLLSNFNTPSRASGVFLNGSTAYIADSSNGLLILNISNPAVPSLVGTYDSAGGAKKVQIVGSKAYISDWRKGLKIVDISNPESPTLLGRFATEGDVTNFFISSTTAYIIESHIGMEIVDISNPADPQLLSKVANKKATGVWVAGEIACLTIGYDGFQLINISNLHDPQILASKKISATVNNAKIVGTKLYLADSKSGLQIFNISDPTIPTLISSHNTPGTAENLQVIGNTAFIASSGGGLNIVNISDPENPVKSGYYDHSGRALSVWVNGSTAYLAKDDGNLQIIDVNNPGQPIRLGHYDKHATCVQTIGNTAYIGGEFKFRIVDVSNPANPTEIGNCRLPGGNNLNLYVTGSTAYIASHSYGLQIIDISDPTTPTVSGTYQLNNRGAVRSVYVINKTAYLASYSQGLIILDVNQPDTPVLLGTYDTPGYTRDIDIVGSTAFIADGWKGLQIVNIADPANPVKVGEIDLTIPAEAVQIVGEKAYVITRNSYVGNLKIIDISNPGQPQVLETVDTVGVPANLFVVANKAYIADETSGRLMVINLSTENQSDVYFPHAACNRDWTTEVALINTGTIEAQGDLIAYDDQGKQVGRSLRIALEVRGRRSVRVNSSFANADKIGYLVFRTGSQTLLGYTKFYNTGTGYRVAIPMATTVDDATFNVSHIVSDDIWWTGIALLNTSDSSNTISVTFSDGQTKALELAAHAHKSISIRELFENTPQPQIGSAVITGCNGIVGLEIFGRLDGGRQLSGITLSSKTNNTIFFPHIATDQEWWTGLVAYDPTGTNRTLTVTPFSQAGEQLNPITLDIPAGNKKYVSSAKLMGLPANAAWMQVEAVSGITGFELFGTNDNNRLAGYTGVNLQSKKGIFAKLEQGGGWTGLALVNSTAEGATVTLRARNNIGRLIAKKDILLNPHERIMGTAESVFAEGETPQDISDATYISYESNRNLVGFQINGEDRLLDALPALKY